MAAGDGVTLDCAGKTLREVNALLREAADGGTTQVELTNPQARHNLGVSILKPLHMIFRGDVGYYCCGLSDHITAEIHGSTGWGVGDNLINGEIIVHGNAATSAGPSLRGGTVVVHGNSGPRTGIYLKAGQVIVGGDVGYMTGFMMQKGRLIICGNAASGLGDSMYQGSIYLGGECAELGSGLEQVDAEQSELDDVFAALDKYGIKAPKSFRKFQSDRSLWHFRKQDFKVWKDAL